MEISLGGGKTCLLCRRPRGAHSGGDYDDSPCMETLRKLLGFLEEYRGGIWDGRNFEVAVRVRSGRVSGLGPPEDYSLGVVGHENDLRIPRRLGRFQLRQL